MNTFLVFEGLSGVGKTTLGRLVARKIGATFYQTPSSRFRAVRDVIDKRADIFSRFLFYLAGVCDASTEIKEMLSVRPVVCDRYILTTVCFHSAIGVSTRRFAESVSANIILPDFTFLVRYDEGVRLRRLKVRGLTVNDRKERRGDTDARFLAEYQKRGLIEIDNSSSDPNDACTSVLQIIGQR